jgi:hypothetical protein
MQLTLLLIAAILVVIWLFLRRRNQVEQEQRTANAERKEDTTYHAVSIKFSGSACDAAKEMAGRRFLATAAPQLPLPQCDAATCDCRFTHHKDRRAGQDRRSPFAAGTASGATGRHEQERRQGSGRRSNDDTDSFEI